MSDDRAPGFQTDRAGPVHDFMGLRLVQQGPDGIVTMELTDNVRGSAPGTVHGGMLATLADVTSAIALWGAYDFPAEVPVTTDLHIRFYRQPRSGPLTAKSHLVHRGRRLLSAECSITDADDRVLARSTATYMIMPMASNA